MNRDVEFNDGDSCAWNESFTLRVSAPHDALEMEIYDYDAGDEDDLLGGLRIPVHMLTEGKEEQCWWRIRPACKMHIRDAERVASEHTREASSPVRFQIIRMRARKM